MSSASDRHIACVGVDVGGTNTDAVLLSSRTREVLGAAKALTTADVMTGVREAICLAAKEATQAGHFVDISQVNIGTTHFVNAVLQRRDLAKVAVIRICGPSTRALPPFVDFPVDLIQVIQSSTYLVAGGHQFDGRATVPLDLAEIATCIREIKESGVKNIAVIGVFSPVIQEHEKQVAALIRGFYPEASVTVSHDIGYIGLLERENATILNECLKPLCVRTVQGFRDALNELGLACPFYLTQNDGTIISAKQALQYPVTTFASGPTNSMRGAAYLSDKRDAIVIDIGGTTTDVGMLVSGFPREASKQIKVGGVRTNFRMPDVLSIGLGGGSLIHLLGENKVTVGPVSVGYRLVSEGYVFGGKTLTATDIAVASGLAEIGQKSNVTHLPKEMVSAVIDEIHRKLEDCIDQVKISQDPVPVILVGGGSILVDESRGLAGAKAVIKPEHFGVANAIGAALSQVSGSVDYVENLVGLIGEETLETALMEARDNVPSGSSESEKSAAADKVKISLLLKARSQSLVTAEHKARIRAIEAGADSKTLQILELSDTPLAYIPGNASRLKAKAVGNLSVGTISDTIPLEKLHLDAQTEGTSVEIKEQTATSTGSVLEAESTPSSSTFVEPEVNQMTGEWTLSEWDLECLAIGVGIMGCGGGGHPYTGKTMALNKLREGKRIRVATPECCLADADSERDIAMMVAFMGAPLVMFEKIASGTETPSALSAIFDLYNIAGYKNSAVTNMDGIDEIIDSGGLKFIENYQPSRHAPINVDIGNNRRVVAIVCAEIGGLNSMEPLIVGATMDLPVLDCDGMGRAFPELQMFSPFMYGWPPFPASISDDKNTRNVVLYAQSAKHLEDHFRKYCIGMGCAVGLSFGGLNKYDILEKCNRHTISRAWRLGKAVMDARRQKRSPIDAILEHENGKLLIVGKLTDVRRETTGGFNRGTLTIEGMHKDMGKTMLVDFQNENLVARLCQSDTNEVVACVPDLIAVVDHDTGEPIMTEDVRYGLRVAVLVMACPPLMCTPRALEVVGPQAFGYGDDVQYHPVSEYKQYDPIPLKKCRI